MDFKKLFSKKAILALGLLAFGINSNANNVQVTGTAVSGSNISFNISWENSWYASIAPANWDAVWVFVKYQDCATRQWYHADINATGNSTVSPLQVDITADAKGVFLRRSAVGGGNIPSTAVTLSLNIPAGTYNYKVFAVEMVHIPQAAYELGDGASASRYNSITVNAASQSGGLTSAVIGGASQNVPATFPMGYNAFYCMKYEITQEQYVDFLNTLTYDQQKERTPIDPISAAGTQAFTTGNQYRNGIEIETPGNNNTLPAVFACDLTDGVLNNNDDGQNIAMNWMSWADLAAYLDWSALRPMTEMEFEKISRGPLPRVANEYPWGTTDFSGVSSNLLTNPSLPNENYTTVVNGRAMVSTGTAASIYGPSRVGIFASTSTGRASSGAAYYGVMEMGGNVWERTVTTGNTQGVAFTGNYGDGALTNVGSANVANWPDDTATGTGYRGNAYYTNSTVYSKTSDRSNASVTSAGRSQVFGGRGVR